MKKFYKILFLFVLVNVNSTLAYSSNKAEENTIKNTVADPSGQITGNATVCLGATEPLVKFEVKDGNGKEPYTFFYKINDVPQPSITTQGNDKSITVAVPTNIAGTFTYVLTGVEDKEDNQVNVSGTKTVVIKVNPLPVVDFTFTDNQCSGSSIQFNTSSNGNTYTWNFGDGATSSNKNPTHTFISRGCSTANFNVTLTITDFNGCSNSITKTVTINQQPDVNFKDNNVNYNPLNTSNQFNNCNSAGANPNYNVSVDAVATNSNCISSYSVIWQDGGTPEIFTTFPFIHTYTSLGAFKMAITAIGNNGCSTTKYYTIKNESNPAGGLVSPGSTTNLCAPTPNLQFTMSNWALNSPGTTYSINYGDSTPLVSLLQSDLMQNTLYYNSTNPSLSLNYPVPHIYNTTSCPSASITATLIISNSCGTTNSTISPIVILRPPTPDFTNSPNVCVNSCVQITNESIPAYNESCIESTIYEWNFGDGSSIYTINAIGKPNPPCHTYTSAGNYTITLTTYGYCGVFIKTGTICVEPPPLPNFTLNNNSGCSPRSITATNTTDTTNSCTPPTYVWSVGFVASICGTSIANIPSQTTTNASFSFTEPGTYTITLTATNSCGSFTTSKTVTVKKPPIVSISPIASLCQAIPNTTISPTAVITNCGTQSPLTYEWSFPGGTPTTPAALATANPGTISYSTSGTFPFSLKVTNECGFTIANSSFTINPSPTITGTLFSCIGGASQLIGSLTAAIASPWTSSVPAVATVNNTGLVTGVSAGTTTITYTDSNGCKTTALFTVNPSPTATISGTTTVCLNAMQPSVTFTGANGVAPYTFTYNINGGTPQTVTTASGNSVTVAVPTTTAGIYQYNLVKVQDLSTTTCSQTLTTFVMVTVRPLPTAGITGTTSICQDGTPAVITFTGVNGTAPYTFTYNINGGTTQTVTTITGNSVTVNAPTSTSGIFTYNLVSVAYATAPSCPQPQSSSATVTVNPLPTATIVGTTSVCLNTTPQPVITFTGLGGTAPYSFTYTINGGTSQNITTTSGSSVTIPVSTNTAGTFTYNLVSVKDNASPLCSKSQTGSAIVIVKPLPTATIGGTTAVCLNANQPMITFTGTGGTAPYTFTYTINGGAIQTITTTAGNSATLPVLTSTSGTFVYTLFSVQDGASPSCTAPQTGTATITVNTLPSASISGTTTICQGGTSPQITFTGSNGVSPYTFSYNINGGITQTATTISGNSITVAVPTAASGSFTYNLLSVQYGAAPSCAQPQTGSATVTINAAPTAAILGTATVCLNDTPPTVTYTGANGVAPYTFTYNINGGTPQTITTTAGNSVTVTAPTTTAGTFQYNLTGIQDTSSTTCSQSFSNNVIVVVNLRPIVTNQTHTICSDSPFGISLNSSTGAPAATYNITAINSNGLIASAGNPVTGPGLLSNVIADDAWTNITALAVDVVYTVVPVSAAGCVGNPFTLTVTINPEPVVANQTGTICSDIANGIILGSDVDAPSVATYNITNINNGALTAFGGNPITGTGFSANEIADDAWTNTTPSTVNVIYTVVPVSASGCTGNPFTVTVTVESTLGVGPQTTTTCSDVAHGFILGTAANTTYTITNINSNGLTSISGNPLTGTGFLSNEIANDIWNNSSVSAINVIYTVEPVSSNGCSGQAFTVTVVVNPEPVVANQTHTICSDSPFGISLNSSTGVPATTYKITVINSNGLIASAGNPTIGTGLLSNVISDDAWTNITAVAVDVVYTVVPVSAAGCAGNPFTVTVTINPEPVVANQTGTICSGIANGILLGNDVDAPSVATYNITNINNGALTAFGGNPITGTGFSANEIADDAWTNTTPSTVNVIYTVVPVSASGCTGNPFTVTVTVESTLGVGPQTTTTCSDVAHGFILGTAANTTYTITNINPNGLTSISGNPVAGTGFLSNEIANDIWNNSSASAINVIYTVEPVSSNGCSGQAFTVTVVVNPEPVVANQINTICSDSPFGISLNSSTGVPATTYNITAINSNGLIASAGNPTIGTGLLSNVIADDAWTNITAVAVDVVYTVVPVSAAGCAGNPFTVTVTINPEPVVANQTGTICSDIANGIILGNDIDAPSVVSYNITNINTGGLVASAGNPQIGTGFSANEIADDAYTNTTPSTINVIYTVVPVSASGCTGNPFTVTVTVQSTLGVGPQTTTTCSDVAHGFILGTTANTTYTITNINPNGLTSISGNPVAGTGFLSNEIANDIWNNSSVSAINVIYTVEPVSSNGCSGQAFTITVVVNPEPVVTNQINTICSDSPFGISLNSSTSVPATTYNITAINSNGLIASAGGPAIGTGFTANVMADDAWTNITALAVDVVYTLVPVSAAGCTGNPFTLTVTINPEPVVANQTGTICSDIANGIILGNDVDAPSVATYNITTINNGALTAFGGNPITGTGFSANEIADDAWTNTTPSTVNVIYTVVPVSASGCTGNPFTVTVTVESTLGVGPQTTTTCSDVAHGFILGTTANTTYTITNINSNGLTSISGNPVAGTGFLSNEIANDIWNNSSVSAINVIYTVEPVSSNGCSGQAFTVTVTVNPEPVVANQINTICSDSPFGISLNSSTGAPATTYNITAINSNGLIASAGNPVIGTGLLSNVIADDAWTNITALAVDVVYTVVPVSASACAGNPFTLTVTINPEPVVANQTGTICSDIANGIILGNDIDAPSVVSYNITNINNGGLVASAGNPQIGIGFSANEIADDAWTNTTPSIVNVIYTVVPVSASGCTGNPFTVTVTVESTLGVGPQTTTTCSDVAHGFILGTSANTTYTITNINSNGLTSISGNPAIGTGFGANEIADDVWNNITSSPINVIYTVEPVSANGCSGQPFTVTVTVNPEPIVANQTATFCSDSPFGISLNSSTAAPAATYEITVINSNGLITSAGSPAIGTGFTANVMADDAWTNTTSSAVDVVYSVIPVSAAGCAGNPFTVTVTINPEPFVANQTGTICSDIANGIILGNDIDTPSAVSYNITNINTGGLVASAGNPITSTGFLANEIADDAWTNTTPSTVNVIYTVVPVSASGCTGNPFTVTVMVESELAIADQLTTVCSDAINGVILGTEPTATYTITSIVSNGLSASGGNPQVGTGFIANVIADDAWTNIGNIAVPIVYHIIPQSSSGCSGNPFTITVTINPEPIVAGQVLTVCSDEPTNVILGDDVDGPSATTYSITNINSNGLFSFSGNPKVGNGFSANEIVNDAWTNTTLLTVPVIYEIIPVSATGCQGNPFTISINVNPQINIAVATTPIRCYGANDASITLTITGGITPYTISWSNLGSGTFQDNLSAGDYLVTVTDANNCTKTLNVNIPEAPIFTVNPVVKNISCFGDKNGSINLNIVGGIAPVKLVWDDSAVAGNVRNNLGPGSYTVTITDGKPCTIVRTFIILEPQLLVLSANLTDALDCDNANSGAINLLVSGGSAPFTYSWSNGAITEDLTNIPAGNYLVTVKDANGCSKQAQYSINRPPPIVTSVETKTDFNCDTKTVKQTFVAQVTGGVPPYQLVWSSGTVSGANNELMNTSQNGTVILIATDAIGCKSSYTFTVAIPTLGTPSYTAGSYANSTYGTYSINDPIQFTNTATGDYISMIWDFGDGSFSTDLNPVHTFINPKEYVVTQTVTYPFGCVYVQKITFIIEKGYVLVVPTAFTPNNDSLNDTFRPVTKGLKNVRLDVYDTWGSMIYSESGDILKGWDGKIKGVNSENGNYYCKVSGETFYGIIINDNTPFVLIK